MNFPLITPESAFYHSSDSCLGATMPRLNSPALFKSQVLRKQMKVKLLCLCLLVGASLAASATTCTQTGFYRDSINMTAALINPTAPVTGTLNATGCNIGVYFDKNLTVDKGSVDTANIYGANYFGVLVNGDDGPVSVNITDSQISNIGETPLDGTQHGVAIYYRGFFTNGGASGTISGNTLLNYQKGGIVANGPATNVSITENTVTGQGHISYIAQNGIQVGYGATASVMRNTVTGNSYTGTSTVSGGIIVLGGPGYDPCPGNTGSCAYSVGARIMNNIVRNNDVGIWLTNIDAGGNAPASATNIKVVNNTISSDGLFNHYGGVGYQAGIADQGNNDKMTSNSVSGNGYSAAANPGTFVIAIDADASFTNKAKVHANTTP
jgi:hypothetical protein